MDMRLIEFFVFALFLCGAVAKPVADGTVEESCTIDASVFQEEIDLKEFSGKWFIAQDDHPHVGKWNFAVLVVSDGEMHFQDMESNKDLKGTWTANKDGVYVYQDDTHTTELRIVQTDYTTAIMFERLVSEKDTVGDLGDSNVYALSRESELTESHHDELFKREAELKTLLCLHPHESHEEVEILVPEMPNVDLPVKTHVEGSGDHGSGVAGSGEAGSGVAGSGDVGSGDEGSGEHIAEVMEGSGGESSGEASGEVSEGTSECGNVICMMFCEYGFKTDENGCDICACVEETCHLLKERVNANIKMGLEKGEPLLGAEPPVCEEHGNYGPKQCSGSACYCVKPDGKKFEEFIEVNRWDAQDLSCKCAREQFDHLSLSADKPPSVHCDKVGNYYPVQCSESQCFCVDPSSGVPVKGSEGPLAEAEGMKAKCTAVPEVMKMPVEAENSPNF